MITILILEDDNDKLSKILNILESLSVPKNCIRSVNNLFEAKKELVENFYDLLILDINVPIMSGGEANRHGGLTLLKHINERKNIKIPSYIIGLTAYEEIRSEVSENFEEYQWHILQYDLSSDVWVKSLSERVDHITMMKKQRQKELNESYLCDICIVTALESPELTAVRALDLQWTQEQDATDNTIYHRGIINHNGKEISVIAASACKMGMPHSTAIASKMIMKYKPQYLWMLGICAGIAGKAELGDIIVADRTWDYGNGKFEEKEDGKITFSQDHYQYNLDAQVSTRVSLISTDTNFTKKIKEGYAGTPPEHSLSLKLGAMASGSAVVSSSKYLDFIKDQCRKLVGIEMEGYGVMCAGETVPDPKPSVIIAKSVCDFADADKDDDYQEYAAYTSAQFFLNFTKEVLYNS